jgi:hypothetical protein
MCASVVLQVGCGPEYGNFDGFVASRLVSYVVGTRALSRWSLGDLAGRICLTPFWWHISQISAVATRSRQRSNLAWKRRMLHNFHCGGWAGSSGAPGKDAQTLAAILCCRSSARLHICDSPSFGCAAPVAAPQGHAWEGPSTWPTACVSHLRTLGKYLACIPDV